MKLDPIGNSYWFLELSSVKELRFMNPCPRPEKYRTRNVKKKFNYDPVCRGYL